MIVPGECIRFLPFFVNSTSVSAPKLEAMSIGWSRREKQISEISQVNLFTLSNQKFWLLDTENCGRYVPDIAKAAMNQCVAFIRLRLNHRTITTTRFDTTDTATEKWRKGLTNYLLPFLRSLKPSQKAKEKLGKEFSLYTSRISRSKRGLEKVVCNVQIDHSKYLYWQMG